MAEKTVKFEGEYVQGLGRRKSAVAQVRLYAGGSGKFIVNGREMTEYFPEVTQQQTAVAPFVESGMENTFDVSVRVVGGGLRGQSEAVRLGVARGLLAHNPDFRTTLKHNGFLTRDARKKERKKYGKKGARRSPQWSKR